MYIVISYWSLAGIVLIGWFLQVILGARPSNPLDDWFKCRELIIKNSGEFIYLLLAIPMCWVGHNMYLFNHQLSFILWIVRIYAAIVALTRVGAFVLLIPSLFQPYSFRLMLSTLSLAAAGALVALAA